MSVPLPQQESQPLTIEESNRCRSIADNKTTPTYVYFGSRIRNQVGRFVSAMKAAEFATLHCHYAMLANDNPHLVAEILRALADFGATPGVLCASVGHVQVVTRLRELPPNCGVVYSDAGMTPATLRTSLEALRTRQEITKVYLILNTEGQIETFLDSCQSSGIHELVESLGPGFQIGVRIKLASGPGAESEDVDLSKDAWTDAGLSDAVYNLYHGPWARFGVPVGPSLKQALKRLHDCGVRSVGFHMYPGTNLSGIALLRGFYRRFADVVREALSSQPLELAFLDVGGGFGINYATGQLSDPRQLVRCMEEVFAPLTPQRETVLIEPGRTIIGPSAVLVTSVVDQHEEDGRQFVIVDAGLSHFPRAYIYQQPHRVVPLFSAESQQTRPVETFVSGCTMASGDFFAGQPSRERGVSLPRLKRGDLLGILDAGAYGFSMSSSFSGQTRACEVLACEDGSNKVIRHRQHTDGLMLDVPKWPELV